MFPAGTAALIQNIGLGARGTPACTAPAFFISPTENDSLLRKGERAAASTALIVSSGCWSHVAACLPPALRLLLRRAAPGARRLARWLENISPPPRLCLLDLFEIYLDDQYLRTLARHLPPTTRALRVHNNRALERLAARPRRSHA